MLENLPSGVGRVLGNVRPGLDELVIDRPEAATSGKLAVTSPAFADGGSIPVRFSQDGAKISPPLEWKGVPTGTAAVMLIIEDADSPTPSPLVHAIVADLPGRDGALAEGALPSPAGDGEPHAMGRNSFLKSGYLPPDPPPGHGPHRYAFQVFALRVAPDPARVTGRRALIEALKGNVLAKGCLIGTYERA